MSRIDPFHTNSEEYPPAHRNVYHDQSDCSDGREIKPEHRVAGTDGRPRCDECQRLSQ